MDLKVLQDTPPWNWPKNAAEKLLEVLKDPLANSSDKLVAAELAGDLVVINDELADSLMQIVSNRNEPEQLRARAAIALGPVLEQSEVDGFEDFPSDVPITEEKFRSIQGLLQKLYFDNSIPKLVRRRILEASVRAPEPWHSKAISAAYSSGDRDWVLTAVFSMRWVAGFNDQILEALRSPDPDIHYEAVEAAGNWGVDGAWPHVLALVKDSRSPKHLRIAAIGAVAVIRPAEAPGILADLADSEDEEIAEAAEEAIGMADIASAADDEDDEEIGDVWIH